MFLLLNDAAADAEDAVDAAADEVEDADAPANETKAKMIQEGEREE